MSKNPIRAGFARGIHQDRLSIVPWTEKRVYLTRLVTSRPGPFRADGYQIEILNELCNIGNEAVVEVKANQVAGSLLPTLAMAYFSDQDPGHAMWTTANQDLARAYSKDTLMQVFQNISMIDERMFKDRSKTSTFEIRLPSMTLTLAWGGSTSKAEQANKRFLFLDEYWDYPDLVGKFEARTTTHHNSLKVYISKPTTSGDLVADRYDRTDKREWHWPCLSCGAPLPLKFKGHIFFDKFYHATGKPDWARIFPTIRYVCPQCKHEHFESSALHSHIVNPDCSKWIPQAPKANEGLKRAWVGFRWNALLLHLIDGMPSWEKIVQEFINADIAFTQTGSSLQLQELVNKRFAEWWEVGQEYERKEVTLGKYLLEEAAGQEWDFIFLAVDVQHHNFWHEVAGWRKKDGFSRRLSFGLLDTVGDVHAKQNQFKITNPARVFLDAKYRPKDVHSWCAKYGWTALQGMDRSREDHRGYPHDVPDPRRPGKFRTVYKLFSAPQPIDCGIGTKGQGRTFCIQHLFDNASAQEILQRHIDGNTAGGWEIAANIDPVYRQHLAAVRFIPDKNGKWAWRQLGGQPEHGRDCAKIQIVAAAMAKCIVLELQGEARQ